MVADMPPDRPAPLTTIPFYSLRLRNLVHAKARIMVVCGACRRTGTLDPIAVLAAKGPKYGVKDLEKALRCEGCGQKGFAHVRVEWL
jgi:hypothetical protein